MISVAAALQAVLNTTQEFGVEQIPFLKSGGRVLKEAIYADRDFPPFHRVSMDGISIDYTAFKKGQRSFRIAGTQAAGSARLVLQDPKNCLEVMTGSVLPDNTNTVIRYEDITIKNGIAIVHVDSLQKGQNIHEKGKDRKVGDLLIAKNTKIAAAEIGVLATVGKSFVNVAKQPKIMIVSTGDELVDVGKIPQEHQIRRSNVFTLVSLLEKFNIASETTHLTDDKPILKSKIKTYLQEYDVLLFSGAVSKGKFDFLPEVFDELGVEKLFHKVAQRPGKPFWFGSTKNRDLVAKQPNNKCTIVFGFPGNPISTFVNCLAYFYPWYYNSVGMKVEQETAILSSAISFKPDLTYFLQVKLSTRFGHLVATPVLGNGSGDLASMIHADAFIQLPQGQTEFEEGAVFPVIRYR